ncbi:MAG: hypothetical protein MRY83_02990 [Flavobacteriales bacterium]|nr:hypothetical protein [Flavobacteriales bacterium]
MERILILMFISLIGMSSAIGQSDTLHKKFELSFGQAMLFISSSEVQDILENEAIIVPTNSMLFFAELRPLKRFRIPIFFNLPTETKQFLLNGQIINERASPTFGSGAQFQLARVKFDERSQVQFEAGPLVSFLMSEESKLVFAPISAGRFRIIRDNNFVMYIGTSYSFGINSWGLFYGTGFIF